MHNHYNFIKTVVIKKTQTANAISIAFIDTVLPA